MELKERNAAIVALFDEGKTLEETGAQFGITRERVRQIIKKAGRTPRRVTIAEEIRVRNEKKAAWRAERIMQRESTLKPYLDKVRAGASFLQAAGDNPSLANRINFWAKRKGIKSSARSKWCDFSKRHEIVAAMAAEGKTWPEIANAVNKAECNLRRIGHSSIYNWAYNHGYVRTRIPKPGKPRNMRKGITSSARSKWNDLSKRHEIVATMAAEGKTWSEIADAVNKAECNLRPVGHASIYMWAYNHGYVRTRITKPEKPRNIMPEIPAFCANHAWSKDMKEAAQKWREEGLSATFVADRMNREFGVSVTRNAVIGAWRRMREAT